MRWLRPCRHVAVLGLLASLASHELDAATPISLQKNGALAVAGRSLRCPNTRAVLDSQLPNLGLAARGVVVFNPRLLNRQTDTVRLFVFHHECGHHYVGGSETGADCWAVKQGVRQGWLNREGLAQVCRSFGNAPETPTHPSGASRCASLDQCFANVTVAQTRRTKAVEAAKAYSAETGSGSPELISGPTFLRDGKR
jgi:hypothetical protein